MSTLRNPRPRVDAQWPFTRHPVEPRYVQDQVRVRTAGTPCTTIRSKSTYAHKTSPIVGVRPPAFTAEITHRRKWNPSMRAAVAVSSTSQRLTTSDRAPASKNACVKPASSSPASAPPIPVLQPERTRISACMRWPMTSRAVSTPSESTMPESSGEFEAKNACAAICTTEADGNRSKTAPFVASARMSGGSLPRSFATARASSSA